MHVSSRMAAGLVCAMLVCSFLIMASVKTCRSSPPETPKPSNSPFDAGERLRYKITYKGLPVGESVLTFYGEKPLRAEKAYLVVFSTSLPAVKDEERLYAQIQTFLPMRIQRSIKRIGTFPLQITESYDQDRFKVQVNRKGNFGTKDFVIQKTMPIHNAILLTYYYRQMKSFEERHEMKVALPTVDFKVMFKGKEYIKTALGEFPAYAFTSTPSKFKLWLSADEKRIPLRIEDPNTLGYSLEIKKIEYIPKEAIDKEK